MELGQSFIVFTDPRLPLIPNNPELVAGSGSVNKNKLWEETSSR
jgi:hypothetical protein